MRGQKYITQNKSERLEHLIVTKQKWGLLKNYIIINNYLVFQQALNTCGL